jgi:hypothetical protein
MTFYGLRGHYLGMKNVDNMSTMAEMKLTTTLYHGEKRRWNFERYVKVHTDQHAILQGLVEHGYAGIDERSKVRHLVAGIKTNMMDPVKTWIMSDTRLRTDFAACVNLFQDYIHQTRAAIPLQDVQVAAVHQKDQVSKKKWSNNDDQSESTDDKDDASSDGQNSDEELLGDKIMLSKAALKALAKQLLASNEDGTAEETGSTNNSDSNSDTDIEEDPPTKRTKTG